VTGSTSIAERGQGQEYHRTRWKGYASASDCNETGVMGVETHRDKER